MRTNRMISLIITVVVLAECFFSGNVSYAQENNLEKVKSDSIMSEQGVLCIDNNDSLLSIDDEDVNKARAIVMDKETLEDQDEEMVEEVLDNGTSLIIETDDYEKVCDMFENDIQLSCEDEFVVGCYIDSDNGEYQVSPVVYDLLSEDGVSTKITEKEKTEILTQISKEDSIDIEDIFEKKEESEEDALKKVSSDDMLLLQGGSIDKLYKSNSKYFYFYKENTLFFPDYTWDSKSSKSGWEKIGSVQLFIGASKVKTINNKTYDNIFAFVTAGGLSKRWVECFKVRLRVDENEKNSIIDYTTALGTDNTSVGGSLSMEVNNKGVTTSTGTSYEYNPNGMKVENYGSERYYKTWVCKPVSKKPNVAYTINPGILLEKKNGKTNEVKVWVSILTLKVRYEWDPLWHTIDQAKKCSITIKNHS